MKQIDIPKQLDRLEVNHPPIPLDSVDFTIKNPELLTRRLAKAFRYFGRVEREVERNVLELEALLPNADANTRRFYEIWEAQEVPHGLIFDELQRQLGLEPELPDLNTISRSIRAGGVLSHIPGVHDVLMQVYLSTGAMHERLTAAGYDKLKLRLMDIGETALVETAVSPIRQQESGHFAYYKNAALLQRDRLSPWQLHLVRLLKTRGYAPVGAGNNEQKADFGEASLQLGDESQLDKLSSPVQAVAQELLVAEGDGLKLPLFVARGLREAVELHRQRRSI